MDAGVAAVLGATVGALGTAIAAVTTGWIGARNVQQQVTAQLFQMAQQQRFEHVRDRRDPRSQAYADLIAQTQAVGHLINVATRSETYTVEGARDVIEETATLLRYRARVAVEGPGHVAEATDAVCEAATGCRNALTALAGLPGAPPELQVRSRDELIAHCGEHLETLDEALGDFIEVARQALDDDGGISWTDYRQP